MVVAMTKANRRKVLQALSLAMRAELEGEGFYTMAARATGDAKGRRVLQQLADEERTHQEYLRRHHASLVATGELDPTLRLAKPAALAGVRAIFSADLARRVAGARIEMTTLGVGVQLELNSVRFYEDQAGKAPSVPVRTLFEALADWETVHYRALLAQYDDLKTSFWQAAGFEPF